MRLLQRGKPHLYYVEDCDLILSRVIKIFVSQESVPRASTVLFCDSRTSSEQVLCFLDRCCAEMNYYFV